MDNEEVVQPTRTIPTMEALEKGLLPNIPLLQTSPRTIPSVVAQEPEVLKAVERFAYRRHEDLTPSSVIGFDEEDLDLIKRNRQGCLVFTVEDVYITEVELDEDDMLRYYVSAKLQFQTDTDPVEGSTDIYLCNRCGDEWCIEWYAS